MSLVLTTSLILFVASWATAQRPLKSTSTEADDSIGQSPSGQVIIERDRRRYVLVPGYATSNETDKYFLYDSWDVAETKDIWVLTDPHKVKNSWKRIPFDKK